MRLGRQALTLRSSGMTWLVMSMYLSNTLRRAWQTGSGQQLMVVVLVMMAAVR